MPVTVRVGDRVTAGNLAVNSAIRKVEIKDKIWLLEPNKNPLTLLTSKAGRSVVKNPEFKWLERERTPVYDRINKSGGYTSGNTSLVVDNAAYVPVNSLIQIQRTGETMFVSAVNTTTNTLTVSRSWGTTSADALLDNDQFTILGGAAAENAVSETSRSTVSTTKTNYTEIKTDPFGVSRTTDKSDLYGGSDIKNLRVERGIEHSVYIENAAFFGEKREDATGDAARRSTGGLKEFVSTNTYSFSGNQTLQEWFSAAETAFRYGDEDVRFLFVPRAGASNLALMAEGHLRVMSPAETFGISMSRLITPHGEWNVVSHPLLQGDTYGKMGWSVPIGNFHYVYLTDSDTELQQNIQENDRDGMKEQYLSEFGFRVMQERTMMEFSNLSA